jgi:predicted TIM-barrel fold metal-dependent hydrolase
MAEELQVCDAHMHCWDQLEKVTKFNNPILGECGSYLPDDYRKDLLYTPGTMKLRSCVHVEAFPTDQVEETRWLDSLKSENFPLGAIVANANISLQKENEKSTSTQAEGMEALEDVLKRHKSTSGLLRGIRWVLNYDPNWPQVHRNDYFTDPQFREGFNKLEEHSLSYDLQLNPHQMKAAAEFFKDFPNVPVVLNHVGSLKLADDQGLDSDVGKVWYEGMKGLAALPWVYCKLSMLAYTVPGWWKSEEGKEKAKKVVLESIAIFGPERCMFASNFPAEDEPCRRELYSNFKWMVKDMSPGIQEGLFYRNAERFYKIDVGKPDGTQPAKKLKTEEELKAEAEEDGIRIRQN